MALSPLQKARKTHEEKNCWCSLEGLIHVGEVPWASRTIREYHERAVANRVKIVHMCGFDSVPSDLGAFIVVNAIRKKYNRWSDLPSHARIAKRAWPT